MCSEALPTGPDTYRNTTRDGEIPFIYIPSGSILFPLNQPLPGPYMYIKKHHKKRCVA
jgi:hypothetical protein